jgi:hypothetical protein
MNQGMLTIQRVDDVGIGGVGGGSRPQFETRAAVQTEPAKITVSINKWERTAVCLSVLQNGGSRKERREVWVTCHHPGADAAVVVRRGNPRAVP